MEHHLPVREIDGIAKCAQSQISDQQLEHLIEQVWGVAGVKKLKVDQVEALISWAKEDYFVEEVEAVLALIDGEGSHARSDR